MLTLPALLLRILVVLTLALTLLPHLAQAEPMPQAALLPSNAGADAPMPSAPDATHRVFESKVGVRRAGTHRVEIHLEAANSPTDLPGAQCRIGLADASADVLDSAIHTLTLSREPVILSLPLFLSKGDHRVSVSLSCGRAIQAPDLIDAQLPTTITALVRATNGGIISEWSRPAFPTSAARPAP